MPTITKHNADLLLAFAEENHFECVLLTLMVVNWPSIDQVKIEFFKDSNTTTVNVSIDDCFCDEGQDKPDPVVVADFLMSLQRLNGKFHFGHCNVSIINVHVVNR